MAAAAASSLHLAADPGWLAAADAAGARTPATLLAAFLAADLNAAGGGSLPADVETWHDRTLTGRHVLQVDEIVNAGAPAKQRYDNARGAGRLLKLLLTDGRRHVVGFELESVPCLNVDTEPGAKIAVTDALVLNGMLALRPANVALLTSAGVPRLACARRAARGAWAAPATGAAAGDGPDLYARARAAAWQGDGAVQQPAAAAGAQAAAVAAPARPPPPPPPPPPAAAPPPPQPKPDPDPIVILSDDDGDDDAPGAAGPPASLPRARLTDAAAAALAGVPTLARARVAGVASPLAFMDAVTQAPLPEFGLDIDLVACDQDGSAAPPSPHRTAARLSHALASRLLGPGVTPATLVAEYAAAGPDAVMARLAGLKRALAAFRGWVALAPGGDRAVVTEWWPETE